MQIETALQRLRESFDGDVAEPVGAVRTRAEAAVDRAIGIQQEARERLIVVVLEKREVEAVGGDDANADVLFEQRPKLLLSKLPSEMQLLTVQSGFRLHKQRRKYKFTVNQQCNGDGNAERFDHGGNIAAK